MDDSEDNRSAVRRHLEKAGFRVAGGASGEDTLRLVRDDPDIVILVVDLRTRTGSRSAGW